MSAPKLTPDVIRELAIAEASAWLARKGSMRPSEEAAFREWLAASPAHRRAFERVSDVWEMIPGAVSSTRPGRGSRHPPKNRRRWGVRRKRARLRAMACAALVLAGAVFAWTLIPTNLSHQHVYQTAIGQKKTVVLADSTRVVLNTDTRIIVDYTDQGERNVRLERGEVLVHVTRNEARPFVLRVGNNEVRDLGTVFDVKHYTRRVAITLLEGKLSVGTRVTSDHDRNWTVLAPGEQLTVTPDGRQVVDRPQLAGVTAWEHGQLVFEGATLSQETAELNRYNETKIHIADPEIGSLRLSGVFSVRDPEQFATIAADLHHLRIQRDGKAILLKR